MADLGIEHAVLIGDGRGKTAGVQSGQIVHHLGKQLHEDEEALQGVVRQRPRPGAQLVEDGGVAFDEATDDRAGKDIFVLEMIEDRSEEHTSELKSLMRISYAFLCLK